MKDYLSFKKKFKKINFGNIQILLREVKKTRQKLYFLDLIIILFLLNVVAFILIFLYLDKIHALAVTELSFPPIKITSIPDLPLDLEDVNASAAAYIVYDTSSRTVIAGKNQNLRFSPASTAKIMTALISLEHYKIDQYLKVPLAATTIEGSKMNLFTGEEISVRDLLYGMMLPSGNDAAYTLAYNYSGGVKEFVDEMNTKARQLKLENTHFTDPAGYEDNNYTTGIELARLASVAMENDIFRKIVATRFITVNNRYGTHPFFLQNLNELLAYSNVKGIKTGFTNEAGGVLVTAVEKDGKLLIVIVLKSSDRFYDTKDLMKFIDEKVQYSQPPVQLPNLK